MLIKANMLLDGESRFESLYRNFSSVGAPEGMVVAA